MKKRMRIFILSILLSFSFIKMDTLIVKANEKVEICIDFEKMTEEEAFECLKGVPGYSANTFAAAGLEGMVNFSPKEDRLSVAFSTTSKVGIASEIGVKLIYVQCREADSDLYGNTRILDDFYTTNASWYMGGFSYLDPEVGKVYRIKLTHYFTANGVDYSLIFSTKEITFTGK